MEHSQIDSRFITRPHGDNIFVNQLYGFEEKLRLIFFPNKSLEESRYQLLSEINALMSNIDQPVQVVVAGGFNAGKSTFINALTNRDLMPVKSIRTTATVNCLISGKQKEYTVHRKNGTRDTPRPYTDDFDLNQNIRSLMEKEHNTILKITITCPDQTFLDKFTLIDTPGLDHNLQDSETSLEWVKKADAIIWLLHSEGLRKDDMENISTFHAANPNSPLIVIINQIDTLEPDEQDSVYQAVTSKLLDIVPQVFLLSAKKAFDGRKQKDTLKLDESRFNELNHYLYNHLFNAYRDIIEERIRNSGQSLLQKLNIFFSNHSGESTMQPVSDLSQQIEKLHQTYLEKAIDIQNELMANLNKTDSKLLKRFHESSAIKAGLVNILRYTHQLISFEEQYSQLDKDELNALTNNIENQVFRIGVFGSFSSGKSTLINQLLGNMNLLPVDEDRCTAAYTLILRADDNNHAGTVRIQWKSLNSSMMDLQDCIQGIGMELKDIPSLADETNEMAIINWITENKYQFKILESNLEEEDDSDLKEDQTLKRQIALMLLKALPQYCQLKDKYKQFDIHRLKTLMQDELAVSLVRCIEFYHDDPLLRHVQVIDSPGSGSVNLRDEFLAQCLVKQSHVILFLTEATTAIQKKDENNLLNFIGKNSPNGQINNLFILANKVDLSENKPERIVEKITTRIDKLFKGKSLSQRIIPISCKTGLNMELFIDDLHHFLQADKDKIYLSTTDKSVERVLETLIENIDKQLEERDQCLRSIADQIEEFQKDKAEKQESMLSHLNNYELICYKSKQQFKEALIAAFDTELVNFKNSLKNALDKASRKEKQIIVKSQIDEYIKFIVRRVISNIIPEIEKELCEIMKKVEKEFQKMESDLINKYQGIENFRTYDSTQTGKKFYDYINQINMNNLSLKGFAKVGLSSILIGVIGMLFEPITGTLLSLGPIVISYFKADATKQKIVEEITSAMEKAFKHEWYDKDYKQQQSISLSIINTIDKKLQNDINFLINRQKEEFNLFLQFIENKLEDQYNEKSKTEIERQTLQHNRTLISEEFKFLKGQQSLIKANIQALYTENNTNTN